MDAQEIKALRLALGLTQTQLAARLGVAANTVYRWETGHTHPDPRARSALLRVQSRMPMARRDGRREERC